MAKRAYYGVDDTARRIKKIYVGVDGVARKVRKAYVGIDGVARPFFSGGEITYYGAIPTLVNSLVRTTGAAVADTYGVFAGGKLSTSTTAFLSDVVAYTSGFSKISAPSLPVNVEDMCAASVGDYAIFIGGWYAGSAGLAKYRGVHAYNKALVRTDATALTEQEAFYDGSWTYDDTPTVTISNYAIFAKANGKSKMYDASLTATNLVTLSVSNTGHAKFAKAGNYAIFARGTIVRALDTSLVQHTVTHSLTEYREDMCAASTLRYALFGGGFTIDYANETTTSRDELDVYDGSLTKINAGALPVATRSLTGGTLGEDAMLVGFYSTSKKYNIVYKVDNDLVQTRLPSMNNSHRRAAIVSFADRMLVAASDIDYSDKVDVYMSI